MEEIRRLLKEGDYEEINRIIKGGNYSNIIPLLSSYKRCKWIFNNATGKICELAADIAIEYADNIFEINEIWRFFCIGREEKILAKVETILKDNIEGCLWALNFGTKEFEKIARAAMETIELTSEECHTSYTKVRKGENQKLFFDKAVSIMKTLEDYEWVHKHAEDEGRHDLWFETQEKINELMWD